jgi:hypothetical protein
MNRITLLGPQRHTPTVSATLDHLEVEGTIAVVTAGWQEREAEVDELQEHVRRPVVNLRLHERAEDVFQQHPEVFDNLRARQDHLKRLQQLYRRRLDHILESARETFRLEGFEEDLLEEERRDAVAMVRTLDAHHRERVHQVHVDFEAHHGPRQEAAVAEHQQELAAILDRAGAVAVAGGHVAVLLNRLRLFDLPRLLEPRDLPVVAWSAGAMALSEQVVLFHDRPPQGAGNAEILDVGLGLAPDVLPLPHAQTRLRLEDPVRVSLFARRFAPLAAITLEAGTRLSWDGETWHGEGQETRRLRPSGAVSALGVS